eukprot:Phypoly_transcript_06174.p1 GENE.Phypoly_transcript_06174~~Phypoly_transcript_06174.p1  ORF type:complete len:376 (+),score=27.30 Phypoly_transcript_06174:74-1201(+)
MGSLWEKVKGLDYNNVFSYSTVKFVVIKDKRLGLIHHILQFAIFVYIVLYNILYEQRYLLFEPPYGNIRATLREPPDWTDASTLPYCHQNQSSYNGFPNYDCAYITGIDLPYPAAQENALLVTTRIKDTYYAIPPNCSQQTNPATSFRCRPGKNITNLQRYYIADIEEYTIFMEHAIFGHLTDLVVSNADCNGKMLFRNGSKNAIIFKPDNRTGDILPISTLLDAANIKSLDAPSGLGSSYRYDGVLIVVVITYKNYITQPMKLHYTYQFYEIPKQDVVNQEPSTQVSENSTMQRNWYGVRFVFLVVGQIGVFDFPTLLTSLVNGMVLIKLATVMVDMLILYIMPEKQEYTYVNNRKKIHNKKKAKGRSNERKRH